MACVSKSSVAPSNSFQRALDKFLRGLTDQQRHEFPACKLEDVWREVVAIQKKRGDQKNMRDMARLQKFLEAMSQYEKVVDVFLNTTPFLSYVWGPLKFILQMTNAWVDSFDTLLNAYQEIGERLPSFLEYQTLFDKNPDMRKALELYFCDILEFHYHALKFLNKAGWKRLFQSSWKTFETRFRCILDSLQRHKELIESGKSTLSILELQLLREKAEAHYREVADMEAKKQFTVMVEKLNASDFQVDQEVASERRRGLTSGEWVFQTAQFQEWSDTGSNVHPILYISGVPGAGKTTLASLIIERLSETRTEPVLYFYCKHNQPGKTLFLDVLRALIVQCLHRDNALLQCLYDLCATTSQVKSSTKVEELATVAFQSHAISFVILDGLDECKTEEVEMIIKWLTTRQCNTNNSSSIRLLCVGQRTEVLERMLSSAGRVTLENIDHKNDVHSYITKRVREIGGEFDLSLQVEVDLIARVTKSAQGMFLYAKVVLENLANQVSRRDIMGELEPERLPANLEDAYDRVVSGVLESPQRQRTTAMRVIKWVVCARRPLKWREVQASFFIDPKNSDCDYQDRRLRKSCKKLCSSLIDLQFGTEKTPTEASLHLVHDTARDYLVQKALIDCSIQDAKMSLFCTEYLTSAPFRLPTQEDRLVQTITRGYYALQDYAILHTVDHLENPKGISIGETSELYQSLALSVETLRKEYSISDGLDGKTAVGNYKNLQNWRHFEERMLYLRDRIRLVCNDGNSNDPDGNEADTLGAIYGHPKFYCSRIGCNHFSTGFETKSSRDQHMDRHNRPFPCLELGCPYHSIGFETEDQLTMHVMRNHAIGAREPLKFPRPRKKAPDTIHKACARGDADAVERFLDNGVSVNSLGSTGPLSTPLVIATQKSHLHVCKLLVEKGADINGHSGLPVAPRPRTTPLHAAVSNNDIEMVQYLLSSPWGERLDFRFQDRRGQNPFEIALEAKATAIVDLLRTRMPPPPLPIAPREALLQENRDDAGDAGSSNTSTALSDPNRMAQTNAQRTNALANMFLQRRMAELWPDEMENLQQRYGGSRPPDSAIQQTKQMLHERVKKYVQQNERAMIAQLQAQLNGPAQQNFAQHQARMRQAAESQLWKSPPIPRQI